MKVRFRFAKLGKVKWTSHRDLARMWERAFRRIELPVAYTQGYSPRPRVSFGLALPTGYESVAEYLDVDLDEARLPAGFDPAALAPALSAALPAGIDVLVAAGAPTGSDSLQQLVTSCTWEIFLPELSPAALEARAAATLAAAELHTTRERKGRETVDDIRPAIHGLALGATQPSGPVLMAELATHPRALRPAELLAAMGGIEPASVRRTHQWSTRDGAKQELLPLAATDAAPALERVS